MTLPNGTVNLRDVAGPPGAPTVVLLHGWTATTDTNFHRCYERLAEHFRVLAFDHRGHGTGLRSRRPFRLADCADDVVAVADEIGVCSFIPVGYSLGGAVAQLVARRHPEHVKGLVLCSTAARFSGAPITRRSYYGLNSVAALLRLVPAASRRRIVDRYFWQRQHPDWEPWALEVTAAHDWRMVLEAGASLARFDATNWLGELDKPAAVVVTELDEVIPPVRQHELARLLGATTLEIDAGHDAAVNAPQRFLPAVIAAIASVVERAP